MDQPILQRLIDRCLSTPTIVHGIVLDIYTECMVCCNCNACLLGMQHSFDAGFIACLSAYLEKNKPWGSGISTLIVKVPLSLDKAITLYYLDNIHLNITDSKFMKSSVLAYIDQSTDLNSMLATFTTIKDDEQKREFLSSETLHDKFKTWKINSTDLLYRLDPILKSFPNERVAYYLALEAVNYANLDLKTHIAYEYIFNLLNTIPKPNGEMFSRGFAEIMKSTIERSNVIRAAINGKGSVANESEGILWKLASDHGKPLDQIVLALNRIGDVATTQKVELTTRSITNAFGLFKGSSIRSASIDIVPNKDGIDPTIATALTGFRISNTN